MDESKRRLNAVRAKTIVPFSLISLFGIGIAAVLGIVEPGGSAGYFEIVCGVLIVINLFIYFQTQRLSEAIYGLVAINTLFIVGGLYVGTLTRIGDYWLLMLPILYAILLNQVRLLQATTLTVVLSLPALYFATVWDGLSYSAGELAAILIAVIIAAIILSYYHHATIESAEPIVDDSSVKHDSDLMKEIAQRQNAESQMASALEQLEQNNQQLERITAIDEATISSIGEAVLIVDKEGNIVRANPSTGRVLGINQEEIIGRQLTDHLMFAKQSDESTTLQRQEIVIYESLTHRAINDETYRITQPNGKTLYALMTASPLVVSGEVYGAVVVIRDVTQEVSVDRAKTEFVSIASHQLRTPLSTINWYLEMVLAGDFGEMKPEQAEFIQEAYDASKRMGDLINALLNASRLDVGVVAVQPEENVDIRKVLHEVITDLEARTQEKKIVINQSIDTAIPLMRLDPRIMEIIFLNLLTNAVKYSPEASEVEVRAYLDEKFLVVEVEDHGYGIPANAQERIFTKMFRAENAVEQQPDGNGLGLYIIKSIVETLGGSVSFVSKESIGSTFTVKLPKTGMQVREGAKQLSLDPNVN